MANVPIIAIEPLHLSHSTQVDGIKKKVEYFAYKHCELAGRQVWLWAHTYRNKAPMVNYIATKLNVLCCNFLKDPSENGGRQHEFLR